MIRFFSLGLLVTGLLVASQPANGQPKQKLPTVAEVLGKLKEKREAGGTQRYKLEFDITFMYEAPMSTGREVWELQIDWRTGKFRGAGWKGWGPKLFEQIEVYDGEKLKTQFRDVTKDGKPAGDGSWKYGVVSGRLNSRVYQVEYWPLFFQKGAIRAVGEDLYHPGHFIFDPDPDKFFIDGEVTRDGRKCISLKTVPVNPTGPMQYEYIIDPKKDYSVVGFMYSRYNAPYFTLDIDVAEAKPGNGWVLRGWKLTSTDKLGHVSEVVKAKVTDFDPDVKVTSSSLPDIVPPEGAKVSRSHYFEPAADGSPRVNFSQYEVKKGKLVQTGGPAPPISDRVSDNRQWFALQAGNAATAFVVQLCNRRGVGRGPIAPPLPPAAGG